MASLNSNSGMSVRCSQCFSDLERHHERASIRRLVRRQVLEHLGQCAQKLQHRALEGSTVLLLPARTRQFRVCGFTLRVHRARSCEEDDCCQNTLVAQHDFVHSSSPDWPFAKAPRHNTTCIAALPARTHLISAQAPIQTPPRANPSPSCSLMQHHQCHLTPSQLMPVPARALLPAKDHKAATPRSREHQTQTSTNPMSCTHRLVPGPISGQ